MTVTIDQVTALVVAMGALVAALAAIYREVRATRLHVNSKMDALVRTSLELGLAQGRALGPEATAAQEKPQVAP